jgi:hypothetical protein
MSKIDRLEVDKLTGMDADYPHDDAVPELPPVPDAANPPPPGVCYRRSDRSGKRERQAFCNLYGTQD